MLMVLVLVVAVAALLTLMAAGLKGLRDGDRPLDVTVRAAPPRAGSGHPEGAPRSVLAWVHNPGPVPVLVGLSVRRCWRPGWLGSGLNARVPWHTGHPKFGPQAQDTMGVVAPGESEGWPVPAPARGRHGRLVAVAGQADGRLRMITLTVPLTSPVSASPVSASPPPTGQAASQPAGTPGRSATWPGRAARPD